VFSSASVWAAAFGYGIGFLDISPKQDYDSDYTAFSEIKTNLEAVSLLGTASISK
jgi:hypothetical protein